MEIDAIFLLREPLKSHTVALSTADKGKNEHKYAFHKTVKATYHKKP